MPMDFAKLTEKALPATVLYAGERIKFSYFAGKQARELEKAFEKISDLTDKNDEDLSDEERELIEDSGRSFICDKLVDVIDEWDVEVNGQPLAIDADVMVSAEHVPTAFYTRIAGQVLTEMNNGGQSSKKR